MPSFDIMSEADSHEVKNATDQVEREIAQRYDFRGTDSKFKIIDDGFELTANSEERVKAIYDVLCDKFIKRKISLKFLDKKDPTPAGGASYKLTVKLKSGIDKDQAKNIVQIIKNEKSLKVTPAIQGDTVRVTGKKRDDLQEAIALLRSKDLPIELKFENFRE